MTESVAHRSEEAKSEETKKDRSLWQWYHNVGLVVLVGLVCLVNWWVPNQLIPDVHMSWILTLCLLAALTMLISDGITGRFWLGWLINEQNRMSLSRLQTFLWTVVIVSCFIVALSINIKESFKTTDEGQSAIDALDIAIQAELWTALGISTASLIGSLLIMSEKKRKGSSAIGEERKREIEAIIAGTRGSKGDSGGGQEVKLPFIRQVHQNETRDNARLSDLFMDEEASNYGFVDITRLQAFFFTMILIVTYGINAADYLAKVQGKVTQLPSLGASGLSLLAISTTIYLTAKAVPKRTDDGIAGLSPTPRGSPANVPAASGKGGEV